MNLEDYLTRYTTGRAGTRAARTIEAELRMIRLYIAPKCGKMQLFLIKSAHLTAILSDIMQTGHQRTAQAVYTYLHTAGKHNKHLGRAMRSVMRPVHKAAKINYLTPDEARKLITHGDPQWQLAWLLMLGLGLRRGEVAGLQWADIDFARHQITIQRQRQYVTGRGIVDSKPKSDAGCRVLPLLPIIADALYPRMAVHDAETLIGGNTCPYVFCGRSKGGGISPATIDHALMRDLDILSIRRVSVHGLRHTFAASSVTAGQQLRVLSDILGHSAITTTAHYYAHVDLAPKQDLCKAVMRTIAQR